MSGTSQTQHSNRLRSGSSIKEERAANAARLGAGSLRHDSPRPAAVAMASAPDARLEELVSDYGALVHRAASKLSRKGRGGIEQADLEHEGLIGLIEAWQSYQDGRGVPFYAYARLRVRGAMIDSIRREVCVPRRSWARMRIIEDRRTELENHIGRRASVAELAEHCELPVSALPDREWSHHSLPLPDEVPELVDAAVDVMEAVGLAQLTDNLISALEVLTDRQREVIALYYGRELNQLQIGKLLQISEGRVSQIRTQAIQLLRMAFRRRGIPTLGHGRSLAAEAAIDGDT